MVIDSGHQRRASITARRVRGRSSEQEVWVLVVLVLVLKVLLGVMMMIGLKLIVKKLVKVVSTAATTGMSGRRRKRVMSIGRRGGGIGRGRSNRTVGILVVMMMGIKGMILRKLVVPLRLRRQYRLIGVPLRLEDEVTGAAEVGSPFRVGRIAQKRKEGLFAGRLLGLHPSVSLVDAASVTSFVRGGRGCGG